LDIYALADTCDLTQAMIALYRPERWPAMFATRYHVVAPEPGALLFDSPDFHVVAEPVQHFVPTIGVRVLNHRSRNVLAYSSDTEPCQGVLSLARGASLLLHEAAGATMGHSSAAQAGTVAREAGVDRLVLVHYDARETPPELLEQEARGVYSGFVRAARDFDRFTW
jgi:ribonuclease Z